MHPDRSQTTKILIPYLASTGRRAIDYLLLSHGDADHSAGLSDLADRFSIQHIDGFAGRSCRPGRRQSLDANVEILFLSGSGHSTVEPNADSCAVSLKVFDTRILFPGDIGSAQERDIVAYWDRQELATDILIASHHGSKTSSSATWLHRARPSYVVIRRLDRIDSASASRRYRAGRNLGLNRLTQRVRHITSPSTLAVFRTLLKCAQTCVRTGFNLSVEIYPRLSEKVGLPGGMQRAVS